MDDTTMETLTELRKINKKLLKASLIETDPDVSEECDRARQPVVEAIRKLDPASAKNPPPEELDVAAFNIAATGAGTLLVEKIKGRQGGSVN